MKTNYISLLVPACVSITLAIFLPVHAAGQGVALAGNYDGVDYYSGASCTVGQVYEYNLEFGANFTVAGTGSFDLTQVVLPLFISPALGGTTNLATYQVSIVTDDGDQPSDNVIASFTPLGITTTEENDAFNVSGVVEGGASYWILLSAIAPDDGNISWNLVYSQIYPGTGYLAERYSSSGLPTGPWRISTGIGAVQPAFLIEGVAVPEPGIILLFGVGVLALIIAKLRFGHGVT